MKAIKNITLAAVSLAGVLGAVLYSSCAKNQCGAVFCVNKGTCKNGMCTCLPGTGGVNCETMYRKVYAGAYQGLPPDNPKSDTINKLQFNYVDADSPYNSMELLWIDTANLTVVDLEINFVKHLTSGSTFTVVPTTFGGITYTGNGSVNEHEASLQLKRRYTGGADDMVYFTNYLRQ